MVSKWMEENKLYAPSWMIIGISLVLMAVVIIMGIANYHREKNYMGTILKEKGAVLIWSFEAGARTGIIGLFGSEAHLQTLLEETASRSDVSYIALVDRNGMFLAHSDKKMIGKTSETFVFTSTFSPAGTPQWRTVESKDHVKIFEVYKTFLLTPPVHGNMGHEQEIACSADCSLEWMKDMPKERILDPENRPVIVIGMDVKPFEEAMDKDIRDSLITAGVIFLLALTGVVSLFWTQNYMNSRKQLQDIRAVASEIVRNLPVGIVAISEDGKIRFINGVACALLEVRPETTKGNLARSILPRSLMDMRTNISREKPVVEKELSLKGTDNRRVPVNVSTTNIVGEDGQHLGFMFILQDLSELRQLELKIRQREKLAAIGDLAAGIAHEVRNPLSSIKGYVTYFGSLFDKDSENRKAAEITAEEVDRVNRVISELLEFARPADLKPCKTDMIKLIEHVTGIVAQEADFAGVEIVKQIGGTLPPAIVDPDRITQVLLNVLINAIHSMAKGGLLSVETRHESEMIVIDISDTGHGISPEVQANLFNPYFTTKKNGTGLGLAIAHKIVESHGGTIRIHSEKGHGTKVSIQLPIDSEKEVR